MKKKFKIAYIHMGADKTGSTALQSFMNVNRKINESNYGIYYAPDVWHARFASYFSGSDKHFIHNVHSGIQKDSEILALDIAYMETLEYWFENIVNPQKLIFSYEGFHCLTINNLLNMKKYLLRYAEEIQVIYYVRPPLSYAISSKSQHIKMGLKVDDNVPISPYKLLIYNIKNVFDKNEIKIKKFSKDSLYNNDLVMDFLYLANNNYDFKEYKKYIENRKKENESLTGLACFVGNDVIDKFFSSNHNQSISPYDLGWKILPFLLNIEGNKLKLTPKQLQYALLNSQVNSQYIKDEFGIELTENKEQFTYDDEEMLVINSTAFQNKVSSIANDILSAITEPVASLQINKKFNVDTVNFNDIKNGLDIDFLRDEAVRIESFEIENALKLMELAHRGRPEGPFIKAKLIEYRAKLAK